MTTLEEGGGPGAMAELAADAVRMLNRLTLGPPSTASPGWEDVADLCRVVTEVRILTERLPQAVRRLARHLGLSVSPVYRCDAGTADPPDVLVRRDVRSLNAALAAMQGAGRDLADAQGAVAHLAPRHEPG